MAQKIVIENPRKLRTMEIIELIMAALKPLVEHFRGIEIEEPINMSRNGDTIDVVLNDDKGWVASCTLNVDAHDGYSIFGYVIMPRKNEKPFLRDNIRSELRVCLK